jgi:DNA modification methylase
MNRENIKLVLDDCLNYMAEIKDKSVDMILCDLPYGCLNKKNSSTKWDSIIPFDDLWRNYERIIKDNGAIVLFCQGMFTAKLMESNEKLWRYNLVWYKCRSTGFLNANKMPLRSHEDIAVFYKKCPTYNPQMIHCEPHQRTHSRGDGKHKFTNHHYGEFNEAKTVITDYKFPKSIVTIPKGHAIQYHPTEKPVALCEWLIKTYTNEGELVLDNCAGSMSTAIACINTNRKCICIEKDEKFYSVGANRIDEYFLKKGEKQNDKI